jgi:DNA-binding transcriptional regulator YiaG
MAHHYKESGLDNVYLENGYEAVETPYGTGLTIQNTEGLHRAIGLWLVARPISLNGAELRFLRMEMELTQRDLAGILGAKEQTLRIWEKGRGKPAPGPADRLLRAIYTEFVTGDGSVRRLVDRLGRLDQGARSSARLRETPEGWRVDARA